MNLSWRNQGLWVRFKSPSYLVWWLKGPRKSGKTNRCFSQSSINVWAPKKLTKVQQLALMSPWRRFYAAWSHITQLKLTEYAANNPMPQENKDQLDSSPSAMSLLSKNLTKIWSSFLAFRIRKQSQIIWLQFYLPRS